MCLSCNKHTAWSIQCSHDWFYAQAGTIVMVVEARPNCLLDVELNGDGKRALEGGKERRKERGASMATGQQPATHTTHCRVFSGGGATASCHHHHHLLLLVILHQDTHICWSQISNHTHHPLVVVVPHRHQFSSIPSHQFAHSHTRPYPYHSYNVPSS